MLRHEQCDVLVIGGGAAGIAAACSAAIEGARVALVERYAFWGGNATASAVGTICGLCPQFEPEMCLGVFACSFAAQLMQRTGESLVVNRQGMVYLPYRAPDFLFLCDQVLSKAGVRLHLQSSIASVKIQEDRITEVDLVTSQGPVLISPSSVIDCSGDAVVSRLGNQPLQKDDSLQDSALVVGIAGVKACSEKVLQRLVYKEGRTMTFPEVWGISIVPGSFRDGRLVIKVGLRPRGKGEPISVHELEARNAVQSTVQHLREQLLEFTDSSLEWIAPQVGHRSGGRGLGRDTLTEDHVVECNKLVDEVARGTWPIEWWSNGELDLIPLPRGEYYSISAEMLMSTSVDNLFFAGRTMSGTARGLASARVIGTCFDTGAAAGRLACRQ
jgi:hypothetical protein